jgi:hypothetical protein
VASAGSRRSHHRPSPAPPACSARPPTSPHEALLGDPTAVVAAADAVGLLGTARSMLEGVRGHDPALAALSQTTCVCMDTGVAAWEEW